MFVLLSFRISRFLTRKAIYEFLHAVQPKSNPMTVAAKARPYVSADMMNTLLITLGLSFSVPAEDAEYCSTDERFYAVRYTK
jgi:hypothetical protein